jgi:uncharacterized protein
MLLSLGLLIAAIIAVWLRPVRLGRGAQIAIWQPIFIAAVFSGLLFGLLTWPAVVVLVALWWSARSASVATERRAAACWLVFAMLLALALATHLVPGFGPLVVADGIQLSDQSAPMTLRANFDKGAAGLLLAAYLVHYVRMPAEWPRVLGVGLLAGAASALVVIGLVSATGAVHFDPKLPAIAPWWLAINLFFTCLMEEAFFRGVIQHRLAAAWPAAWARGRQVVAIGLPALIFGLVHFGGGPVLIMAATLAGVGYGIAYAVTGRLEAAVIAHFVLNGIHFFGFTYPYAMR